MAYAMPQTILLELLVCHELFMFDTGFVSNHVLYIGFYIGGCTNPAYENSLSCFPALL
jgi:hypothetical protein